MMAKLKRQDATVLVGQRGVAVIQRLSDTERKTVKWLRGREKQVRTKMLQEYVASKRPKTDEEGKAKSGLVELISKFPKYPVIRASMPVTVADAKSIMAIIKTLADGSKTGCLHFGGGLKPRTKIYCPKQAAPRVGSNSKKNEELGAPIGMVAVNTKPVARNGRLPSFGIDLSTGKDGLEVVFRYRPSPGSLRLSDNKRAQGDLGLRLAAARANAMGSAHQQIRSKRATIGSSQLDLDEVVNSGVEGLLSGDRTENVLGYEALSLDDVAWQDFSEYLHALQPSLLSVRQRQDTSTAAIETFRQLEDEGIDSAHFQAFLYHQLRPALSWRVLFDIYAYLGLHNPGILVALENSGQASVVVTVSENVTDFLVDTLAAFSPDAAATIAEIFWALPTTDTRQDYCTWIAATFRTPLESGEYYWHLGLLGPSVEDVSYCATSWSLMKGRATASWGWALKALLPPEEIQEHPEVIPPYNFIYFTPSTWNLGLRLVYRQEWRPLGNQRGEVVKTIPLGPRQTEKVSTRITRRTKVVRTSEDLKSVEMTTEQSTSVKDSSETINEVTKTKKWHIEAEASANFGFGGASVSSHMEDDEEKRSKETTSQLTESSQKMASKIRQETKVTVSTESETTFETTSATEITNPNEEIALTYVYSKLQRQYRLFTQLAEVHNVVMIAESLPTPEGIDDAWVRRHDSILAKALLDDSYRDVLASFGQDRPQESLDQDTLAAIKTAVDNVAGREGYLQKIGSKAVSISLDRVDPSQEAQRGYRDTQREELDRKRARNLLVQKQRRFKQHVRDNLLHYCRAIWSSEDPQQRALRYRKLGVQVPLEWEFVLGPPGSPNVVPLAQLREQLERISAGDVPYGELEGHFRPLESSKKVALAAFINNSGPIGYEGNYAIYYINPHFEKTDLFLMLQILKAPYLDEDGFDQETVADPTLKALRREHAGEGPASYLEQLDMAGLVPELRLKHAIAKNDGVGKDFFAVFKLTKASIEKMAANGHVPTDLITRLRQLQGDSRAEIRRNEDDFIKFLSVAVTDTKDLAAHREALLRYSDQGIFTAFYPEYLQRKNQGAPFLLDTGNLVVDIVPGTGSALEPFKLLHRGIDVLKALEEERRLALENKRRDKLIDAKKYGDPDIEKVTIVTGAKEAAGLVATSVEAGTEGDVADEAPSE